MERKSKYTKELLEEKIKLVTSVGKLLDELGLKRTGGNHTHISQWLKYHEIDTSHLKGQGWSKGETVTTNDAVARTINKISLTNEEVFVKNSRPINGDKLKRRLFKMGWPEKCSSCPQGPEWNGKRLVLQIDHINGIHNDNRLENLQILCPNCHSQTDTFCSKNRSMKGIGLPRPLKTDGRAERPIVGSSPTAPTKLCACGNTIQKRSKTCKACYVNNNKKIDWPSHETLLGLLEHNSYVGVGKTLGVSDNAIRKYLLRCEKPAA